MNQLPLILRSLMGLILHYRFHLFLIPLLVLAVLFYSDALPNYILPIAPVCYFLPNHLLTKFTSKKHNITSNILKFSNLFLGLFLSAILISSLVSSSLDIEIDYKRFFLVFYNITFYLFLSHLLLNVSNKILEQLILIIVLVATLSFRILLILCSVFH